VHRGFDIGNHFCEWCYCYDHDEFPYFTANLEEYPSREQQVLVVLLLLLFIEKMHSNISSTHTPHTILMAIFPGEPGREPVAAFDYLSSNPL